MRKGWVVLEWVIDLKQDGIAFVGLIVALVSEVEPEVVTSCDN